MKHKIQNAGLAALSAILLYGGWPPLLLFPLLFAGLVPLFVLRNRLESVGKSGFNWWVYFTMLAWNILTTWWVGYASVGGAIAMLLANSAMMTLPFVAYNFTHKLLGESRALLMFIFYWLAFEYLHLHWDISFPWLTLGNGLARFPQGIQWYEFTGILGGSAWILILNVLLFKAISGYQLKRVFYVSGAFIIPLLISLWMYYAVETEPQSEGVLIVQPNIDPYNKFNEGEEINQVTKFLALAENSMSKETHLIVLPETAIVEYLDEEQINFQQSIVLMTEFVKRHPGVKILTGASTYRFFRSGEKPSLTARTASSGEKYDSYNTALLIDSTGVANTYHKSRLVPGVEKMPYPKLFGFLEYFTIDMGGISGSLGISESPVVFETGKLKVAPAICYESIYGDYLGKFMQKGANVLAIITNDGWWEDTDGYQQHLYYGSLRAIEFRTDVVRCANTGISCLVNERGDLLLKTSWNKAETVACNVGKSKGLTFYAQTGDYVGKIAAFVSVLFLIGLFIRRKVKK